MAVIFLSSFSLFPSLFHTHKHCHCLKRKVLGFFGYFIFSRDIFQTIVRQLTTKWEITFKLQSFKHMFHFSSLLFQKYIFFFQRGFCFITGVVYYDSLELSRSQVNCVHKSCLECYNDQTRSHKSIHLSTLNINICYLQLKFMVPFIFHV